MIAETRLPNARTFVPPSIIQFRDKAALELWLSKLEELSTYMLYTSAGIFALLPVVLSNLTKPYVYYSLVIALIVAGIPSTLLSAILKLMSNTYFRNTALASSTEALKSPQTVTFWIILQVTEFLLLIQIAAFVGFISLNAPRVFQKAPQIESIKLDQSIVEPGALVPLTVTAQDLDADKLSYKWTTSGGTIVNNNAPTTTWLAPPSILGEEQQFNIHVAVSDGRAEDDRNITVLVREAPAVKANIERVCTLAASAAVAEGKDAKASCDQIQSYIRAGKTPAERSARTEALDSQLKEQAAAESSPATRKKRRWLPCCSTGFPFICDPRC